MVGTAEFKKALHSVRSCYVDTSVLVYLVENLVPYSTLSEFLVGLIEEGKMTGHTSVLSILELNVKPYQFGRNNAALNHIAFFKNVPHFTIHPMDLEIADRAATIRAGCGLKTPDAIHAATALNAGCEAFVGNDKVFKRVEGFSYIHLDDFIR